jgi:hypothetical protein
MIRWHPDMPGNEVSGTRCFFICRPNTDWLSGSMVAFSLYSSAPQAGGAKDWRRAHTRRLNVDAGEVKRVAAVVGEREPVVATPHSLSLALLKRAPPAMAVIAIHW